MLEMEEAIRNHRATVLLPNVLDAHRITVRCGSIFDDTLFALKGGIDDNKHVRVRFLGKPITPSKLFLLKGSIGEPAIDQGGPKREFFMILMNAISNNSSLLEGPPNSRVLRHNTTALQVYNFCCACNGVITYYIG